MGRIVLTLMLGLLLMVPALEVLADGALTNASGGKTRKGDGWTERQMIRCDVSGDTVMDAGGVVNGPVDGETCATGDWTDPLDCRGYTTIEVWYFMYGGGNGNVTVWNMIVPEGVSGETDGGGTISTLAFPGTEDPAGSPSSADPDPLGVDLLAGAGLTMIGTTAGVIYWSDGPIDLGFIVGEIGACSTCDGILHVRCSGGV